MESCTPRETVDLGDLKRKSVRGGMVTFASQGANVIIGLVSTVVLARLLSPNDYGVMAMVVAVTSFAGLFRDLGLSSAAIQKHTLTNAQQSNLFWVNVALGTALTAGLAAAAPLVVWFYHKPEVLWVTVALSANFLIGSLATQSGALLVRQMRFGRQAVATISGALVTLAMSVALAFHGFRYWSLVWGQLAGGLVSTGLMLVLSPFRPGLPSRGTGLREMLKFGAHITAFDFVNYFARNLDSILIGRCWGAEALGFYSRAYSLMMFPINNLRGPINAVAFPAMSRLQKQPDQFRGYYRKVTLLLAFVSMPLTAYLFVAAGPVIRLTLGAKWDRVAPIFAILAITAFIQPVASLRGLVLLSTGRGKRYLHWGIFNAVSVSIGFLCGISWGATGVAAAYAGINYLILYPSLILAFRQTPLKPCDFFVPIGGPAMSSIVEAVVCFPAMHAIPGLAPLPAIFCSAVLFVIIYTLVTVILPGGRQQVSYFLRLASQLGNRTA